MTRLQNRIIISLFALSGFSSLIFQSLWVRVLSLGVGSTSSAISIVLAIFFAGLALGSFVAGHYSSRLKNPIFAYGVIEGLIGLYGLGLIFILFHFHHILAWFPHSVGSTWLLTSAKFFIVAILLLPPTIGMGASLPMLIQGMTTPQSASKGQTLSLLYAINTFGAVAGAFLASFILIPFIGILSTNALACIVNIAILIATWVFFKPKNSENFATITPAMQSALISEPMTAGRFASPGWYQQVLFAVCVLSGFASIAAEVVWNKYLGIYFGTNVYGLGIILSIFLLGIALGSLVLSRCYDRIQNKKKVHANLLLAAVFLMLFTSHFLNDAPMIAGVLYYYLGGMLSLLVIKTIVTCGLILPSTLIFGALFPLTIDLINSNRSSLAETTGIAYALNTFGSIAGSCLAGLLIVPLYGSSIAVHVAVISLSIPLAIIAFTTDIYGRNWKKIIPVTVIFVGTLFFVKLDFTNIIKAAYFQHGSRDMSLTDIMRYYTEQHEQFVLLVEGETAITTLSHDEQDGANAKSILRLKSNGLNESIYVEDRLREIPKYEGLLGLLPYAFSRNPQKAFIVGYGGGYTVDFLTGLDLPHVQVAELEKGVIDAANYVYKNNNPILQRPNLNLSIEDARFVLAAKTYGKFDIIVSQPSHSWLTGVANLFTKEFFEIVKSNLSEHGVYSQWLNLYNMDSEVLRSILRTFYEVFPHGHIFTNIGDQEMIMIGAMDELHFNLGKLRAMTQNPTLNTTLIQIPFNDPYSFLSNYVASREQIWPKIATARINTDVNAFAEVRQSRLFYEDKMGTSPDQYLVEFFDGSVSPILEANSQPDTTFLYYFAKELHGQGKELKFSKVVDQYLKNYGNQSSEFSRLGELSYLSYRLATSIQYYEEEFKNHPSEGNFQNLLHVYAAAKQNANIIKLASENPKYKQPLTLFYVMQAKQALGMDVSKQAKQFVTQFAVSEKAVGAEAQKFAGLYLLKAGDYRGAASHLENYYVSNRRDLPTIKALQECYQALGNAGRAKEFSEYFARLQKEADAQRQARISQFEKAGWTKDAQLLRSL